MSTVHDQQPIFRTVGKRQPREGQPLTEVDIEATRQNARYQLRAPKGLFFYNSHEEMEADRLRWTVDLMAERDAEASGKNAKA